jgi:hypothetical protein
LLPVRAQMGGESEDNSNGEGEVGKPVGKVEEADKKSPVGNEQGHSLDTPLETALDRVKNTTRDNTTSAVGPVKNPKKKTSKTGAPSLARGSISPPPRDLFDEQSSEGKAFWLGGFKGVKAYQRRKKMTPEEKEREMREKAEREKARQERQKRETELIHQTTFILELADTALATPAILKRAVAAKIGRLDPKARRTIDSITSSASKESDKDSSARQIFEDCDKRAKVLKVLKDEFRRLRAEFQKTGNPKIIICDRSRSGRIHCSRNRSQLKFGF